jgi:hypothetical protein
MIPAGIAVAVLLLFLLTFNDKEKDHKAAIHH